jgi:hypothetical protein
MNFKKGKGQSPVYYLLVRKLLPLCNQFLVSELYNTQMFYTLEFFDRLNNISSSDWGGVGDKDDDGDGDKTRLPQCLLRVSYRRQIRRRDW